MKKTIKKAQTGAKSDSLMKESQRKKSFAGEQERIANSQKKYIGKPIDSLLKSPGWGSIHKQGKGTYSVVNGKLGNPPNQPTPEDRLETARKARESAKKDSIASVKSRVKKQKTGGKTMLKRADGSVSQRGLWDNIRANKGSGKKPTAQMLKQERKIKANSKKK
jgi:hypothetical protein